MQVGIIHLQRSIARDEIERDGLIVPENLAVTDFKMVDRERKQLLHWGCAARGRWFSWWKIVAAVRIKSYMDDGLIEDNIVKCQLGAKKRADFHVGNDVVHVGERNILGWFGPANGKVAT